MNANENQCPLVAYLAKRGESINSFSVRADVGKTAIYNLVAGKTDDPHGSVLLAIERATKGAVTMTAIMEWLADRVLAETETRGEHG